jgi:DNA-binding NtrC family response regulator
MSILIAEDDPSIQDIYKEIFVPEYELIITPEGRQAGNLYVENHRTIEAVITDMGLVDRFDGNRVSCFIRLYERLMHKPEKPIIMVTGYDAFSLNNMNPKPEVDAYLQKPFDVDRLYRIVTGLINGGKHHEVYGALETQEGEAEG